MLFDDWPSFRVSAENEAAYRNDAKKFFVPYAIAILVAAFLWRWARYEQNEVIRGGMEVIGSLVWFASYFAGRFACEAFFTLRSFKAHGPPYPAFPVDTGTDLPRSFGVLRMLSGWASLLLIGGFFVLVAKM